MTSFRIALLVLSVNILVGSVPVFANIGDPCTSNNECGSLEYCDIPFGEEDGLCASTCGNGICLAPGEDHDNCPADCPAPTCPNNVCNSWENQFTCPGDCPDMCGENTPGEGICNYGENSTNCPEDCFCGNGTCEFGESYQWPSSYCAADCPPAPPSPPCDNPPDGICDSDESCSCSDCAGESRCQRNPPPPPPTCPLGQIWASWLNACIQVACDLGPATCTQLNNAMCTYNNVPMDFFVVVDTSSSMAPWRRQGLADTVAKSLRVAAENTPGSTITFFSFDDFGYRWEWSDGMPSAPNLNGWVRYKFPGNTEYGMIDYGSNPANRPIVPPFFEYGFFEEAGSQTNMIEGFNALTHVIQQFPVNPTRKKIVYWLSDGEPTIGSANPLCSTGEQPCQTSAAETRADQFRAAYPNIDVVAVGLDTESYEANVLLQNHVASDPSLFNNASSNTIYGLISEFCDAIPTPNHPLNNFTDLYCDEACAPNNGLCGPINGTSGYNATLLTPSTPGMCAPGEVQQLVSTSVTGGVTFTWICASTNGGTGSNQCTATKEYCGDAEINGPEICDTNGNIGCTNDKICQQCGSCVTQGGCGYLDGESIYDFDNAGDALTGTSLGLCVGGYSSSGEWINYITTGFTYDERNHIWTWSCIPENPLDAGKLGGVLLSDRIRTSCTTTEMWCGDWTIQNTGTITYEQLNEQLLKELDTISEVIGLNATGLFLPGGKPRVIGEVGVMQTDFGTLKSHQNRLNSLQTPAEQCETHLDCAQGQNCFGCQCKTVGACHPDLQYFYAAQETPTFFENGSALCAYGQTSNIVYDYNTNKRTYQCVGDPGTPTASCEIRHLFCGDNVVNNINSGYPEDYEECEPGIGVGCTLQCTAETYACQGPLPTNAILCLNDDQSLTGNTTNSLVASCTGPQKCEYVCNAGYDFDGTHCTQLTVCYQKPFDSTWYNGDQSYGQYLSGTELVPTYSTTHSVNNTSNACEFYCNANYTWNGTECTVNMYTVVFSGNGGTGHSPISKLVTGNTILGTLPTDPTYTGNAFNGRWNQNTGGNAVTSTTVITGNRIVYAQWTQLPVTGSCGNANNVTYPYTITQYAPDMQCAVGTPSTTAFPAPGGTVTWTCSGLNGGPSSSQCSASRANTPINGVCGSADGKQYLASRSQYSPDTQCTQGTPSNTTFPAPGDSQTWTCDGQFGGLPSSTCSASRQAGSCDLSNTYASGSVPGRRCPAGWTLAGGPGCYMCKRDEIGIARCLMPECGNELTEPNLGEECDDGNTDNNDACTNDCLRPYCGDGILTPSATWLSGGIMTGLIETCDSTLTGTIGCPSNCLYSGALNVSCNISFEAYLGYGKTFAQINQPGNLCYPYGIASGVVETPNLRTWNCLSPNEGDDAFGCSLPRRRCGDGVVDKWANEFGDPTEECDDNNTTGGDGCSANCTMEPVITLTPGSGLCTIQSYPQVELGEYLPIWWIGNKTPYLTNVSQCSAISPETQGVMSSSILGDITIYRGNENGLLEQVGALNNVPITETNTTSSGMINDAIKDFAAQNQPLIGTNLIDSQFVSGWVNTGGVEKFGQYLMRMENVDYTYCSFARMDVGTVTGQVNPLIDGEDCENNYDDNRNGLIDCADTVYCGNADSCVDSLGTGGGGGGTYVNESDCADGINTPNSLPGIDCADDSCNNAPNCLSSVRPEHCANGIDDDGDTQTDCEDFDCNVVPFCKGLNANGEVGLPACAEVGTTSNTDEDNDGLFGCNDPSCLKTVPTCNMNTAPNSSICFDSLDNEFGLDINGNQSSYPDSYFSQMDPQCFLTVDSQGYPFPTAFYSREMDCYNGEDLGGFTGAIDCADPTCQFMAVCGIPLNAPYIPGTNTPRSFNPPAEVCTDGSDNDGDGRADCSDFNCKTNSVCLGSNPPPPGGSGETLCGDNIDNDGDLYKDCADGDCAGSDFCTLATNEHCFNDIDDGDLDTLADELDEVDCGLYYEFVQRYDSIPAPVPETNEYTYTGSNVSNGSGYVCKAGFSVSKGYFVQQGFAFSEEANAGLDSADFVSIGGVPLVTEGTVLDDGENNVATYSQQTAKTYLFSGFVEAREQKAMNQVQVGTDQGLVFRKVPNAHIYFWQGETANLSGFEILELDKYDRDEILREGGVERGKESTTPYTIVLPGSDMPGVKQILDIQGTLTGNALYVSQGDIRFSSSQGSCDFSDTVEGLFIAAGEFTTTPINNRDPLANRRCKGGNLKIRGTLLGSNAGSTLAPLRRSVIDARNPNATFFDNSLVFQAKELFETCYLPALAHKKASTIYTAGGYTPYNGPLSNCNIDNLYNANYRNTLITASKAATNDFLGKFTSDWNMLETALKCIPEGDTICQKSIAYVYSMMDNVQNASTPFFIPSYIIFPSTAGNPSQTIQLPSGLSIPDALQQYCSTAANQQTLICKMNATNKRFPARRFQPLPDGTIPTTVTIDMNLPENKIKMMNDVSRAFGEIKDAMVGFGEIKQWSTNIPGTAVGVFTGTSSLSSNLTNAFKNTALNDYYLNNFQSLVPSCSYCHNGTCSTSPSNVAAYNRLVCSPDYKWLKQNTSLANNQGTTLASNIVDGSSVVISSQPKLWTDLPPGAKDFLNNIVVVPR